MTQTEYCRSCGHESECIWRCENCGKLLDGEDNSRRRGVQR